MGWILQVLSLRGFQRAVQAWPVPECADPVQPAAAPAQDVVLQVLLLGPIRPTRAWQIGASKKACRLLPSPKDLVPINRMRL